MKKRILPAILAVPLLLAGCAPTDFADAAERNAALMEYTCIRITEDDPREVFGLAFGQAKSMPQFQGDQANLLSEHGMAQRANFTPTCDSSDPTYMPWVPQGYAAYLDHHFTYEDAEAAGVID